MSQTIQSELVIVDLHQRRVTMVLYSTAVFFFWAAQYIYLPTLPTFLQSKVVDLSLVGFILSMYGLWQALVRLPLGIVSDWFGWRKPFIIFGLALSGVGAWIMATSNDALGLSVGRSITGAAAGSWVVLVVAFSALFPPEEAVRASALLTLFNTAGRIAATATTGILSDISGITPFLAATGIGLFSALIILPVDIPRRPPNPPTLHGIGRLIMRRDVMLPTLLSTVAQFALWTTSFGFLTLLAKNLGGSNIIQSAIVTTHLVFVVVGNLFASSQAKKVGTRRMLYASFALLFIGMLISAFASSLVVLFAAPVFIGLALGIGYPVTMGMSIEKVDDSERTIAMGMHQAVYAIGMFAGPALSGILAERIGLQPMFGALAFVCVALGITGTALLERSSSISRHDVISAK